MTTAQVATGAGNVTRRRQRRDGTSIAFLRACVPKLDVRRLRSEWVEKERTSLPGDKLGNGESGRPKSAPVRADQSRSDLEGAPIRCQERFTFIFSKADYMKWRVAISVMLRH
jgi:hypothetical protein